MSTEANRFLCKISTSPIQKFSESFYFGMALSELFSEASAPIYPINYVKLNHINYNRRYKMFLQLVF